MKSCLAIRHVAFENLGTLELVLRQTGYQIRYIEAGRNHLPIGEALTDDLLIVLGGPIGAYEEDDYPFLRDELDLLERRIKLKLPTLGICLGAQLMAKAMGAEVRVGSVKEIGWAEVVLTETGVESPLRYLSEIPVLHWHGDTFDLPADAVSLASTMTCPHQAFAVGDFALGLQFHAEVDTEDLESWLIGHAVEINSAGIAPKTLREGARRHGMEMRRAAEELFSDWLSALPAQPVHS